MKNLYRFIRILAIIAILNVSCRKDDPPPHPRPPDPPAPEASLLVSQYLVYDGMAMYYLWNEQMLNREPTETDTDPFRYFQTLLHPTDIRNRWSWITDDVDALLRNFAGESARAFGFAPFVLWADQQRTRLVGLVRYIYPNTPAEEAEMRRGDIIFEINGEPITEANWRLLFDGGFTTTLTVYNQFFQNPRPVIITPRPFPSNPVIHSSVHRFDDSDRVIGYLFYTAFRSGTAETTESNFNGHLFQAFRRFQQEGVNELVLDLRYNPGGEVSAAIYLASMIAPREAVENNEIFTIMSYNRSVNADFDRRGWERGSRLGVYDTLRFQNPIYANLNLDRVFIIATQFSASASELTIFCLRPFMDVYHIGGETQGKYTASWTVHAFDNFFVGEYPNRRARAQRVHDLDRHPNRFTAAQKEELRNWAMQPIVGQYTDRNGRDFATAGTLRPDFPIASQATNPAVWLPIGNRNDYLFSKAISLITGQPRTAVTRSASDRLFFDSYLFSPQEMQLRRAVNVDNIEIDPEMLREMLRSLR